MGPNGTATVPPLHAEMSPDKNTAFGPLPVQIGSKRWLGIVEDWFMYVLDHITDDPRVTGTSRTLVVKTTDSSENAGF